MQQVKLNKTKYLFLALFIFLFLFSRLPGLSNDNVNPDGHNWHIRSEQFVNGLKYQQFTKTYQHYQPGVTLMWIVGPTVEIVKQLNPTFEIYNEITFPTYHYVSKIVLVFVQLVLTVISFYLLTKFFDWKKSLLILSLLSFEPFFVGNSRVLHMDVLLSLLLFNGLLLSYWNLKHYKFIRGIFAGIFLGFSFLTKSVGIGGILFVLGVGFLYFVLDKRYKDFLKYSLSILIPTLLTIFVFLPALWTDFMFVLGKIYEGIADVGIEGGHSQIFFGTETRDPGIFFYPLILFLKTSSLMWVGLILYVVNLVLFSKLKKIKDLPLTLYLGIFYLGYLVVMTIGAKKMDRYLIPMYPYFALIAVYGYYFVYNYAKDLLRNKFIAILFLSFVFISIALPLITRYPYYFTYTNPLFGKPQKAHERVLAQKPFGVGMFEVRDYILENYGNQRPIALLDPKPMFYLYEKGLVKYSLIDGTRAYDIVIVGVNEELPEKVNSSEFTFNLDHTIYINGLEYWKIYVKEGITK